MTYSIIARCQRTGEVGIALATYTLAVGRYCDGFRAGTGVTMSQASVRQVNNQIGLDLLARGLDAEEVLAELRRRDPFPAFRQIGVIDRHGNAACHSGTGARDWKGHRVRPGMVAMGNVLLGPEVVESMEAAFMARPSDALPERLLLALERACEAGGQSNGERRMPERSAALVVVADQPHPEISLRVDLHDHAVHELRRLHERYRPYVSYYGQRDVDPANTPPQEIFEEGFGGQTYHEPVR
jgi:uncharacterized Ntn-hydrolase superfamily protein